MKPIKIKNSNNNLRIRNVKNNEVENYLKNNPNLKISLKKLKNILKLKKSYAYFLAINSKKIKRVEPLDVGTMKKNLFVFTYNDVPDVKSDVDISVYEDNIIDN